MFLGQGLFKETKLVSGRKAPSTSSLWERTGINGAVACPAASLRFGAQQTEENKKKRLSGVFFLTWKCFKIWKEKKKKEKRILLREPTRQSLLQASSLPSPATTAASFGRLSVLLVQQSCRWWAASHPHTSSLAGGAPLHGSPAPSSYAPPLGSQSWHWQIFTISLFPWLLWS